MLKADARKVHRDLRASLSEFKIQEKSKQIAERFFLEFEPQCLTHVFLSIARLKEVDTSHIIKGLQHNDLVTCTGITDFESQSMKNVAFTEEIELVKSSFGIPEPVGGPLVNDLDIDRVLIPLLAFDSSGNRVGYGKGFYDNFLANCNNDVEKIGLSFFEPIDLIQDTQFSDIPLDACITPDAVFQF